MSETETITVKREGLTLSGLLARHYRAVIPGACEKVWALNQDLARLGSELPMGKVVTVPVKASLGAASRAVPVTGLFD